MTSHFPTQRPYTCTIIQSTGELTGDPVPALYGKILLNGTRTPVWDGNPIEKASLAGIGCRGQLPKYLSAGYEIPPSPRSPPAAPHRPKWKSDMVPPGRGWRAGLRAPRAAAGGGAAAWMLWRGRVRCGTAQCRSARRLVPNRVAYNLSEVSPAQAWAQGGVQLIILFFQNRQYFFKKIGGRVSNGFGAI